MRIYNIKNFLKKKIEKIENFPTSFSVWIFSFFSLILIRTLTENWLGNFSGFNIQLFFYDFIHTFLFFLIAYIFFVLFLKKYSSIKKISNILLFGYITILLPPLIDFLISHGRGFWSFYEFDSLKGLIVRFLTFYGENPNVGMTYGSRFEVALAIILISVYVLIKTRKKTKAVLSGLLAYITFFILGTFPSWITILFQGFSKGFLEVNDIDISQMFFSFATIFGNETSNILISFNLKMVFVFSVLLTPILLLYLYLSSRKKLILFLKNIRPAQIFFHWGLLLLGIVFGFIFENPQWNLNFFNTLAIILLFKSITLAWISSVIINDINDIEIDTVSNSHRPLVQKIFPIGEYKNIGIIITIFSVFFAAIVHFKFALFIIFYLALTWVYSSWPLRLKQFPIIATFLSALASILILFLGYAIASPNQSIAGLPNSIILLLIISYTISLPLKDFKDIEGDKKDNVYTLPVLLGIFWSKIIIGSGIFISFILSVIMINEFNLLWWAILFGGAAFWIINYSQEKGIINYRNITWWVLGIVFAYLIVLINIAF